MTKRSAGIASGPLCFGEQCVERFGEFGFEPDPDLVVVVGQDEDLLVESLVEEASDVVGGAEVGGVAVGCEVEGHLEVALDGVPLGLGGLELAGDVGEGLADAVLFLAEEVEGDRSGVVGFHEFAAFAGELVLLLLQVDAVGFDLLACTGEFGTDHGFDMVAEGVIELDALVEVFDLPLDLVDQDGALGAGGAFGVPSRSTPSTSTNRMLLISL